MKTIRIIPLLFFFIFADEVCVADSSGRVVWWGQDIFWKNQPSDHTNGVIESGNEILSNVVAIAAQGSQALLLKSDGTVVSSGRSLFGGDNVPAGLSNVVSVAI